MFNDNDSPPLVLIVDDDLFMQGFLRNLLLDEGYRISLATDGVKAIAEFQRCLPDIVLLDAAMPVMDGFSACRELKKLPLHSDVPVIIITALEDERSVERAFEAGAVDYITKPIHWAVLKHRVQVLIRARRTQMALQESETRFRGLFEQAAMGIMLLDLQRNILYSNQAIQKMLGHSEAQLQGKSFDKLFSPSDTNIEKEFHHQLLENYRRYYQMEKYFFRKNSPMLWGRITTSLVREADRQPRFIIQMVEDITDRKRAEAKQRIASKVFEATSDGIMITNAEGNIIDVNQSFLLLTGYSYEEILDQNPRIMQSDRHDKAFYEEMWTSCRDTGRWRGEIWNRRKNGGIFSIWISMNAVRGEHNEITHYVAVYSDLSSLKQDDHRMRLLTHYDALTELPNRLLFNEYLTRACRQEERIALLYLDLENFKQINETFGFDFGDEFLKVIAKRLRKCIREEDRVARLEGDEFGIILSPLHQEYDARVIADKIIAAVIEPVDIEGNTTQTNCNIGISFYRDENSASQEESVEVFIQQADMAMYLAKEVGQNTYYIYSTMAEGS